MQDNEQTALEPGGEGRELISVREALKVLSEFCDGTQPFVGERFKKQLRNAIRAMPRVRADGVALVVSTPIDMILFCPRCGTQHIDAPEDETSFRHRMEAFSLVAEPQDRFPSRWTNPPHRSHLCHQCGAVWRPADMPTNGVAQITTRGKDDNTWTDSVAVPAAASPAAPAEDAQRSVSVIEGPSSTEYEAWLETRPDLTARFETDTFKRTTGYEIWRNAWLRLRELITEQSDIAAPTPSQPARDAEEFARQIVGTVFDNTAASHETLKQTMIERIASALPAGTETVEP